MATQLASTPIIKGNMILEIIKEINSAKYDKTYLENIKNLELKYEEYTKDE